MRELVELKRLVNNLVRIGTIADVDPARARARLADDDGFQSDWRPWTELRAGTTRTWNPPTIGEQALLLSPGGDPANGVILVGLYADAQPAPSQDPSVERTVYPDGAVIEYNHAAHHLQATIPGSATIDADTHIAAHAGGAIEATAVADITAITQANITATATGMATLTAAGGAVINANTVINGSFTLNGLMIGAPSFTMNFKSPVEFNGPVKFKQPVEFDASMTHDGKPVDSSHRHTGVTSGGAKSGEVAWPE